MSNKNTTNTKFSYDQHARTCDPDDFFGQVRRTVQGKPVSDEQILMIIAAIKSGLRLRPDDVLLELACGNGFLSKFLFDSCKDYLGVDISEHLISIAKKNFEIPPHYQFSVQDIMVYVRQEKQPERFTKMLCYASFQYFPDQDITEILTVLFAKFKNIQAIFIGNIPDKDRAEAFYKTRQPSREELLNHRSAIGIWRTKREFEQLANNAGWKVQFSSMPAEYYASHHRYDALLIR